MKSVCFISLFYPQLLTVHIERYADRQTVGPPPPPHPILTPILSPSPLHQYNFMQLLNNVF